LIKIKQQATSSKIKIIIFKSDDCFTAQTDSYFIEVIETLGIVRNWLNEAGCIGVIVRPDHYVYSGIDSCAKIADSLSVLTSRLCK